MATLMIGDMAGSCLCSRVDGGKFANYFGHSSLLKNHILSCANISSQISASTIPKFADHFLKIVLEDHIVISRSSE